MVFVYIIVGLLVVLAFFFVTRKSASHLGGSSFNAGQSSRVGRTTDRQSPAKTAAPANPFRSTSIVPCEHACSAVQAIAGQRFLDSQQSVPKVPLPACNAVQCDCRYARHDDRRDDDGDRRHPSALQSELYNETGKSNRRRQQGGRRITDLS
ncbi:MAG: hypothetical protein AAGF57_15315 [Pseudomonadota bacterium]